MSWLGDRWGAGGIFSAGAKAIERNRDWAGNLAKNVAPLTALIPGVGVLGAGLIGAAGRGVQHGANIGDIGIQGVQAAGMGSALKGLAAGYSGLGGKPPIVTADGAMQGLPAGRPDEIAGAFSGGGSAGDLGNFGGALEGGASDIPVGLDLKPLGVPKVPNLGPSPAPRSFLNKLGGAAKSVAGSVGDYPEAWSRGLQGLGQLATAGPRNRLANLEADNAQYEFERRKRNDSNLSGLRELLQKQLAESTNAPIARNPYTNV